MASPRRNSTGKLVSSIPRSPSSGKEKPIPHYLRASTGSCHDFCKYGRRHSSEVKERHPFLSRRSSNNAASGTGDSNGGLKAIGTKKSLGRLRGSLSKKVTPDKKIKTDILEAQPSASDTKGSKETEDIKQAIAVHESESLEESASTLVINEDIKQSISVSNGESYSESSSILVSSAKSISSVDDTEYGPESIPSITHDIHVVEKEVCSVEAAETEEVQEKEVCSADAEVVEIDEVLEKEACSAEIDQVLEKEVCSVDVEVLETEQVLEKEVFPVNAEAEETEQVLEKEARSVDAIVTEMVEQVQELQPTNGKPNSLVENSARELKNSDSHAIIKPSVVPRIVKKDRLSMKKSPDSVNSKVKPERSSPASALPRVQARKPASTIVRKPDPSSKSATSLRHTVKEAKQIRPILRSRSPRPSGKFNVTPAMRSKSPTLQGPKKATPSLNTKPSSDSPSILVSTPPVKAKIPSISPGGLNATPSSKSKSSLSSPSRFNATPLSKSASKPPQNPSRRIVRANLENVLNKSSGLSKSGGKKLTLSSRVGPSLRDSVKQDPSTKLMKLGSLKATVSLRNQRKVGAGGDNEKTIHMVERRGSNPPSVRNAGVSRANRRSSLSSLSSVLSRGSDELRDGSDHASREVRRRYGLNKNTKAMEKKGRMGTGLRQGRESTPYKMKFRQGRVVNVQPETNTLPKRLTFRCRRVLGRSPSGRRDHLQRSQRSNGDVASRGEGNANVRAGSSGNARRVALRHQNSERAKKDNQGLLLNQVIEETASKLVETRKSKVKALVGAFETVISLHESKPVNATDSSPK